MIPIIPNLAKKYGSDALVDVTVDINKINSYSTTTAGFKLNAGVQVLLAVNGETACKLYMDNTDFEGDIAINNFQLFLKVNKI